ncbi:MAG: Hexuronate transporter [Syntrophaceae bacterium PtaU1.Bin231]|nr:MAG: Hexuronate transporter [Syntrophaceae bacterium PtaU1.Bin231]
MSIRSRQGRVLPWAWFILGIGFLDIFINYSVRLGYGVVLPEMLRDMGLSRTAGGTIYNAYLAAYIVLTPLTGFLTDRIGARRVIPACLAVLGGGVLLLAKAASLGEACLAYALVGAGAAGIWTPVLAVVQRWFVKERRGLALGILSVGYGLGFAAVGSLFPLIVLHHDWRYTWFILGTAALVLVAVNAVFLRNDPESCGTVPWGQAQDTAAISAVAATHTPVTAILRNPAFWWIGFSYFSISYALYGFTTFMVDYARGQAGMSLGAASFLATIHGSCQVVGVLTILPLSDRLGRRRTILFSNSCITLAILGIVCCGAVPAALPVLVGFLAVFYGATFPVYGACAGDYFPRPVIGTVIGAWTPLYGAGAILSHWAGGALRDGLGNYSAAFLIDAGMAAAAVVLFFLVGKTWDGHRRETEKRENG